MSVFYCPGVSLLDIPVTHEVTPAIKVYMPSPSKNYFPLIRFWPSYRPAVPGTILSPFPTGSNFRCLFRLFVNVIQSPLKLEPVCMFSHQSKQHEIPGRTTSIAFVTHIEVFGM